MVHTSLDQLLDAVTRALRDADHSLRRRDHAGPRLAELSMAFDFRLRYRRVARRRRELVMLLGRPRFAWLDRRPVHQLRLVCLAASNWQPCLEIDGRFIDLRGCA
ncbi:hypothetical protein C8J98_101349 [Luteibacter sp. OK325]|uniref:hypothetical protein n=1 Tax=Luteibacter sp. OK325 TaxID=2135670 RepID=UPI000D39D52C|nr:hypothetical protein [Luteibacter sp. OK325]PTR35087.1 hypothetical protein C8J98_101349 [Luteibacter sp. OK325]